MYHSFVLLPCSGRDVRSRPILLWQLLNLLSSASKTDGRVSFLLVQFEFPIQFHGPSALRTHRGDLFCSTAHTASSADLFPRPWLPNHHQAVERRHKAHSVIHWLKPLYQGMGKKKKNLLSQRSVVALFDSNCALAREVGPAQ